MTLLDSPVATAIQSLHLYPIVYPLSSKSPITGEKSHSVRLDTDRSE